MNRKQRTENREPKTENREPIMKYKKITSLVIVALIAGFCTSNLYAQTDDFNAHYPYQDPRFNTPMTNPNPEEAMMPTITGLDDPQLLFHVIGEGPEDILGDYIEGVGDQNGDGFDDVIISNHVGYCYLYYGGEPMDTIPDMTFGDGTALNFMPVNVGDINGDSVPDFTLSIYQSGELGEVRLYYGGPELTNTPDLVFYSESVGDNFFWAAGGDFNDDTYQDIVIGAPHHPPIHRGKVYIYLGDEVMDNIPDVTFTYPDSIPPVSGFGTHISTGDINDDDISDILIESNYDYFIYFGDTEFDTTADVIITPINTGYGKPVINPDMNMDGYDDIVINTVAFNAYGRECLVYFGGDTIGYDPDLSLNTCSQNGPISISEAGDVNGDGCGDVIIGNFGQAIVFLGGQFMDEWRDILFTGSGLGWEVGNPGDVNGDGINDIMFSRYYYGYNINGQVYIYAGDTSWVVGVEEKPDFTLPKSFYILNNYPNPFNSSTTISFTLNTPEMVNLSIYNTLGQRVAVLLDCQQAAGSYQLKWDAEDLACGVYLVKLSAVNGHLSVRKVMLIK